jgi:hypothetical protein
MEYKRNEQRILVRLDPGDELISSLKKVAKAEGVEGAFVNGIGAARKAEIAHYDTKARKYNTKEFTGCSR